MTRHHLAKGSVLPPYVGKLRIYSMKYCPYAHRTLLVLNAKEVPYEVVNVNLSKKPEWLISKSPLGKVPALEVKEGVTIYESLITAEYLDDKYSENPLTSNDPLRKAQDKLIVENFGKTIGAFYNVAMKNQPSVDDYFSGLEDIQDHLTKRSTFFLAGSTPGMVDYMIWPWFERLGLMTEYGGDAYKIDENKFQTLNAWIERMKKDPAVQHHYLDTKSHKFVFDMFRSGNVNYDKI